MSDGPEGTCCPQYHLAVELIGRRWTGAIVAVLLSESPQRFTELRARVPGLSDRVLSQRMRELEAEGVVDRTVYPGPPLRVEYALTDKGRDLEPVVHALERWGRRWECSRSAERPPAPADAAASTAGDDPEAPPADVVDTAVAGAPAHDAALG